MRSKIFMIALLVSPIAFAQTTGEQIALPFECRYVAGKMTVKPSDEQIYGVIGQREARPVQVCKSRSPSMCQTVIAHRFDVLCEQTQVSWASLMALVASHKGLEGAVQDDQLVVRKWRSALDCGEPARAPTGSNKTGEKSAGCGGNVQPKLSFGQVRFPAGFAPIAELGGELLQPLPIPKLAGQQTSTEIAAVSRPESRGSVNSANAAAAAAEVAQAEKAATGAVTFGWIEGSSADATRQKLTEMPPPADAVTTITPRTPLQIGSLDFPIVIPPASRAPIEQYQSGAAPLGRESPLGKEWSNSAWVFSVLALPLVLAIVFSLVDSAAAPLLSWFKGVAVRQPEKPAITGMITGSDADARACRGLMGNATTELMNAYKFVGSIVDAAPLQSALNRELDGIRGQLGLAPAWKSKSSSDMSWEQLKKRLVWSIQEIRRISSIAEAASLSINASPEAAKLMSTRLEAYSFLGIHTGASPAAMKKMVEGLRQCWHPDLARDEEDRKYREVRIRQINAAWDLIQEKQTEDH
jgi:hypothetical protein